MLGPDRLASTSPDLRHVLGVRADRLASSASSFTSIFSREAVRPALSVSRLAPKGSNSSALLLRHRSEPAKRLLGHLASIGDLFG